MKRINKISRQRKKHKGTLEFDLTDADAKQAFMRAIKSLDMAFVLFEFAHNTKKQIEQNFEYNESGGVFISNYQALDKVFEEFNELMDKHNINLEELIN